MTTMRGGANRRALQRIEKQFRKANSYEQWLALAEQHDRETGADLWRRRDVSKLYDYANINSRLKRLRGLRSRGDDQGLLFALNEGIHGNMAGMGKSALYQRARCGTKALIEDYIREVSDALEYLSPPRFKGVELADRLEFFRRASHCYGRTALMLSGGGTLGYFHFGVLKTLIEHQLCPVVISGASAGAFVAAVFGTRTDAEFLELFANNHLARALTRNSGEVKIGFGTVNNIDMEVIKREMARMIPDLTFVEAYEKTGRSINITISPAEPRQESRLLNHIASPNVTIRSAVLASSALPGVFPAVTLQARDVHGDVQDYLPSRRWIDGSFSQDLPAKRLARMYGINHFIVSQVMPGMGREPTLRPGIRKIVSDASVAATKQIVRGSLDFLQRYNFVGPRLSTAMTALNALIDQQYTADINIFPGYGAANVSKILKMLNEDEMVQLFKAGERATWPKIPAIATTTRIGYTLDRILQRLEGYADNKSRNVRQAAPARSQGSSAKRSKSKGKTATKNSRSRQTRAIA